MENRNNRQQRSGVHEGWRRAPEPERILSEPRPGARRHALMLGGLGIAGALAALLFAPALRVPTEAESPNRSISRTLYPKAPGSPAVVPAQPETPQPVVDAPVTPAEKPEAVTAPKPPEVVIREVAPPPARTESRASSPRTVVDAPRSRERSERSNRRSTPRRSERTASTSTTRRTSGPASSNSKQLARSLNGRAYRLQKQGRHREAEPLLREALRHDPNYAYAQYNLGWALVEQGKGSEAIAPLRKTARQQPDRWEPKAKLREAYRQTGRTERAERSTRRRTRRTASTSERSESTTRRVASSSSTGRVASSSTTRRRTRAVTSTAGWKGSTDPKEQAFLRAWQDFKTKEEREDEERRRFTRRVSEDLIADPRE